MLLAPIVFPINDPSEGDPKALRIIRQGKSSLLWPVLDCFGERTHPLEEKIDELMREYYENQDPEISDS